MDRFAKVFALTLAALLGLCLGMLAPVPEREPVDMAPPDLALPIIRPLVCGTVLR